MFCYNCSQEVISGSNFCHKCGSEVGVKVTKNKLVADQTKKQGAQDKPRLRTLVQSALTFDDFRKRKEVSRSSHFKSKKKKEETTKITVGIMGVERGELKSKRGKRLPVVVSVNSTANAIIQAAVQKHQNHDRKFYVPKGPEDFALLYPDGSEVKLIPGTQAEFKLCDYKNDLGKSYPRISLFICRKTDLTLANMSVKIESDESCNSLDEDSIKEDSNQSDFPFSSSATRVDTFTGTNLCGEKPSTSGIGVQCPTCFKYFASGEIAQHADQCIDECVQFMAFGDEDAAQVIDSDPESPASYLNHDEVQDKDLRREINNEIVSLATSYASVDKVRLSVRRQYVWDDLKKAAKKRIGPTSNLKIVFLGEPAIDDGGPKREFFSVLLGYIKDRFFIKGHLTSSTVSVINEDYKLVGEVMGMSILQGGPAPNFLSENLFSYLAQKPLVDNGCSQDCLKIINKLRNCQSDEELQHSLMQDDIFGSLDNIGYRGNPQKETLLTRNNILQALIVKDKFNNILPQVIQFQDGLSSCGILEAMRKKAGLWKPIFTDSDLFQLSANGFIENLVPEFSESEVRKTKEVDAFKLFNDFIEDLEEPDAHGLSMQDVLMWLTGSKTVPPLRFSKVFTCRFVHGCNDGCRCRPTVSTCEFIIKLPVHVANDQEIKDMMFSAIHESLGFGNL